MRGATFYGEWTVVMEGLRRMRRRTLKAAVGKEAEKLGKAIVRQLKGHIEKQDLPWVPLSSGYIKRKGHSKIYLNTETFVNSLASKVSSSDKLNLVLRVFPEGEHPSGIPIETLSRYLEYGTTTIPARPLWRPVLEEIDRLPEYDDFVDALKSVGFEGRT